jgi:hypothetical protein
MTKYFITFDYGCGSIEDVIDADTQEEADEEAYQQWLDGANSQGEYTAELATSENLTDAGFDPKEYGLEPMKESSND